MRSRACRSGLAIHPGYLSARVTLGRALLEMNDLDAALGELEYVLKSAPENLAAIRGVAEIHHRRGELGEALGFYRAALALARHDPDLEQTVDEISRALSPERPVVVDGLSFEQASAEFLVALEDLPGGLEAVRLAPAPAAHASCATHSSHPVPSGASRAGTLSRRHSHATARKRRSKILLCALLLAIRSRLAMPGFDRLSLRQNSTASSSRTCRTFFT